MGKQWGRSGQALAVAILLAGCGGGGTLQSVNAVSDGPDEFSVMPGKPLQAPDSYSDLPAPTPNQPNLTDPTPNSDAISALGGRYAGATRSGVPATDQALLAYASRYGVASGIRADLAPRRPGQSPRRGLFGRLFSGARGQALDKYKELARLRASGIQTPSAPPKP